MWWLKQERQRERWKLDKNWVWKNVVDKEQRGEKKGVEVKKNDVKGKEN